MFKTFKSKWKPDNYISHESVTEYMLYLIFNTYFGFKSAILALIKWLISSSSQQSA